MQTILQVTLDDIKDLLKEYNPATEVREEREFLSREQVLEMYDIKYKSLYNMIRNGYIKKYGLGTLVRFKKSEIDNSFKCIK